MDNELSQLDALIESDVLDALGQNSENISNEKIDSEELLIEDIESLPEELSSIDIEADTQNDSLENTILEEPIQKEQTIESGNLAKLLSELLNNKTIEITIKIKD